MYLLCFLKNRKSLLNLPQDERLLEALSTVFYRKVFILDCLPLVQDYARTEDETTQKRIFVLLIQVYEALPLVIHVPVLDVGGRVDFMIKNL